MKRSINLTRPDDPNPYTPPLPTSFNRPGTGQVAAVENVSSMDKVADVPQITSAEQTTGTPGSDSIQK